MSRVRFCRVRVGQELAHAMNRRQPAGQVQAEPPQKLGVGGERRRNQVKFAGLGEDMLVNEVVAGNLGVGRHRLLDHAHGGAGALPARQHQDGGFSHLPPPEPAIGRYRNHFPVMGKVAHLAGDILPGAVSPMGGHQQLPPRSLLQHHLPGRDRHPFQGHRSGPILDAVDRAFADPVQDAPIVRGVLLESLAAPVGHGQACLQQQQALGRILQTDSGRLLASFSREDMESAAPHDPAVIFPRSGGVLGELEPSLPGDPAVTLGTVAAPLGENPGDVAVETQARDQGRIPHLHRRPENLARGLNGQQGPAVGSRPYSALGIDLGQCGIGNGESAALGQVPLQPVGIGSDHQELLGGALAPEPHLFRQEPDGKQAGAGGRLPGRLQARGPERRRPTQQPDQQTDFAETGPGGSSPDPSPIPVPCPHPVHSILHSSGEITWLTAGPAPEGWSTIIGTRRINIDRPICPSQMGRKGSSPPILR